jgi:hypothetical protein
LSLSLDAPVPFFDPRHVRLILDTSVDLRQINAQMDPPPHYMFGKHAPIVLSAGSGSSDLSDGALALDRSRLRNCGRCRFDREKSSFAQGLKKSLPSFALAKPNQGATLLAPALRYRFRLKSNSGEKQRDAPHHDGYDRGPARE